MDTGNQGVGSGEGEWGCQQVSMLLGVLCDSPRALGSGDISIDSWGVIEKLIGHCMVRVTCWSQGGEEEVHARLCPGTLLVWKLLCLETGMILSSLADTRERFQHLGQLQSCPNWDCGA